MHPDDRAAAAALFAGGGSGPRRAPLRLRTRAGAWLPTDAVVQDLRGEPAVGAFVLNARDASERIALEQVREQRALEAERQAARQRALLRLYERPWDDDAEPFQIVLEEAVGQLGGTHGSALVRTDRGTYVFAAAVGYDLERLRQVELPAEQVLFGRDWRDGEPRRPTGRRRVGARPRRVPPRPPSRPTPSSPTSRRRSWSRSCSRAAWRRP